MGDDESQVWYSQATAGDWNPLWFATARLITAIALCGAAAWASSGWILVVKRKVFITIWYTYLQQRYDNGALAYSEIMADKLVLIFHWVFLVAFTVSFACSWLLLLRIERWWRNLSPSRNSFTAARLMPRIALCVAIAWVSSRWIFVAEEVTISYVLYTSSQQSDDSGSFCYAQAMLGDASVLFNWIFATVFAWSFMFTWLICLRVEGCWHPRGQAVGTPSS
jgi:hypothetical protein